MPETPPPQPAQPLSWSPPALTLKWPPYFKQDAADEKAVIESCKAAHDAGFATLRMVLEKLRRVFEIDDVDAVEDALEKEQAEKNAKALEQQEKQLAMTAKHMPEKQPKPPAMP